MPSSSLALHVMAQRRCLACGDVMCADPAACLYIMTSRPWGDCDWCDGSGWASVSASIANPTAIFCAGCYGWGLEEYAPGTLAPEEISDNARKRLTRYVDHLTVRLADLPTAVPTAEAVAA
jgi:hypothetical protein